MERFYRNNKPCATLSIHVLAKCERSGFSLLRFGFGGTILQALARLALKLPLDSARYVRNRSRPESRLAGIKSDSRAGKPAPIRCMKYLCLIYCCYFAAGNFDQEV